MLIFKLIFKNMFKKGMEVGLKKTGKKKFWLKSYNLRSHCESFEF